MKKPEPKVDECDNCHYQTTVRPYPNYRSSVIEPGNEDFWFCDICSATRLSKATSSTLYSDIAPVMEAIGYIGNLLLDEIRKQGAQRG